MPDNAWLGGVRFNEAGLVPVVAQDQLTGDVLMLAWADRAALQRTHESGEGWYFSRSRNALWRKGESSGHTQRVTEIRLDCDQDTVLYKVAQIGPACHEGTRSCFSTVVTADGPSRRAPDVPAHALSRLAAVIAQRAIDRPTGSYTASLLNDGIAKIAQKVGEEAVETVVAATVQDGARLAAESADLLYHLLVLLRARHVPLEDVLAELDRRSR